MEVLLRQLPSASFVMQSLGKRWRKGSPARIGCEFQGMRDASLEPSHIEEAALLLLSGNQALGFSGSIMFVQRS